LKAEVQNKALRTLKKESFLAPILNRVEHSFFEQLINRDTHIELMRLGSEGRALGLEFSQRKVKDKYDLVFIALKNSAFRGR